MQELPTERIDVMNHENVTEPAHDTVPDPIAMYADVLKRSLVNWHYGHTVTRELSPINLKRRIISRVLGYFGYRAVEPAPIPLEQLTDGIGTFCDGSYTLAGLKRLDNVEFCVREVVENSVPGDFLEAGVWQGGTCIFMRGLLKALGETQRRVWVADSFEGLPPPEPDQYPSDADDYLHTVPQLAVSLETVKENFARFDLLDDQVEFVKGFFKDTLYDLPIEQIAVLRLDGDMYQSTWETLDALYPKVAPGGFVIVDDYARDNCKAAVSDYRNAQGIREELHQVDWTAWYWQKER